MFLHGSHKLFAYARFNRTDKIVVILNNNYEEAELRLDVDRIGIKEGEILRQLILTTEEGYIMEPKEYQVKNNQLYVCAPRISSIVLLAE